MLEARAAAKRWHDHSTSQRQMISGDHVATLRGRYEALEFGKGLRVNPTAAVLVERVKLAWRWREICLAGPSTDTRCVRLRVGECPASIPHDPSKSCQRPIRSQFDSLDISDDPVSYCCRAALGVERPQTRWRKADAYRSVVEAPHGRIRQPPPDRHARSTRAGRWDSRIPQRKACNASADGKPIFTEGHEGRIEIQSVTSSHDVLQFAEDWSGHPR